MELSGRRQKRIEWEGGDENDKWTVEEKWTTPELGSEINFETEDRLNKSDVKEAANC